MTEIHGGSAVVDVLRAFQVTHFFNVPGESFLPVLDALVSEPSIRVVTNRHESGASFAAEAFAKVSGRPAICMATRGPGASNLSIGIHTAQYDATPMVALLGLIGSPLQGSRAFQEFDPLSMFSSLAKGTLTVGARESLQPMIAQALSEATTGRPGPVVVGIPADLLSSMASSQPFGFLETSTRDTADVQPLLDWIRESTNLAFVMATEAVRGSCAADVAVVASQFRAPVFCAWRRYSAFDNGHPCFAGSIGLGTPASVIATLDHATVVVVFGPIDQVTVDSGHLNRPGLVVLNISPAPDPQLPRLLASARVIQIPAEPEIVARLLARQVLPDRGPERVQGDEPRWRPEPPEKGYDADAVMNHLSRWAPDDAVIVSDAGDFAHALLRQFPFDRRRSFIGPLNGAMGYGLPGAIGAALAEPHRPVFCVAGDGGLLMTVGEMETAVRLGLDVSVIVLNNHCYGTIRTRQAEAFPGREIGTVLGDVHFTEIAAAMGWHAWAVHSLSEFDDVLESAAESPGCRLIEVRL